MVVRCKRCPRIITGGKVTATLEDQLGQHWQKEMALLAIEGAGSPNQQHENMKWAQDGKYIMQEKAGDMRMEATHTPPTGTKQGSNETDRLKEPENSRAKCQHKCEKIARRP